MCRTSDGNPVILNACLAYTKHLMNSRDKMFIVNSVCSKFDCNTIKSAREVMQKLTDPDSEKRYRGPNSSKTDREKSIHALEGILSMLSAMDQTGAPDVTFACPANDLPLLLHDANEATSGNLVNSSRLLDLEKKVAEIDQLKFSLIEIQKTVAALSSNPNKASSTVTDSMFPALQRERSGSNVSTKRLRSESNETVDLRSDTNGFSLPKAQQKKLKKQGIGSDNKAPSYANQVKKDTPKPIPSKKQFTWGKLEGTASSGLRGVVPDVFISGLDHQTTPEALEQHLVSVNISVRKIEQKSSASAFYKSFKVSVNSVDDFDKMISGDHIPKYSKVRKWIHYRTTTKPSENVDNARHLSVIPVSSLGDSNQMQVTDENKDNEDGNQRK